MGNKSSSRRKKVNNKELTLYVVHNERTIELKIKASASFEELYNEI